MVIKDTLAVLNFVVILNWDIPCQSVKQYCKEGRGQNVENCKNHASVSRLLVGIVVIMPRSDSDFSRYNQRFADFEIFF